MFSSQQKKLAISYLLLDDRDKVSVLSGLSDRNVQVLNEVIEHLKASGLNTDLFENLKGDLGLSFVDQIQDGEESAWDKLHALVLKRADVEQFLPPQKLLNYIASMR